MKHRQYESMTRVPLEYWTVRVWMSEHTLLLGPTDVAQTVINAVVPIERAEDEPAAIAKALDRIASVTKYEIVDINGNGVVVLTNRETER